jgi:hypothetical protein
VINVEKYHMPYHVVCDAVETIGKDALDKLVERGYVVVQRDVIEALKQGRITWVPDDRYVAMETVVQAAKRWRNLASIDAEMDLARAVDQFTEIERLRGSA